MPFRWQQWPLILALLGLVWALFAQPVAAGILGGVALFLFGMRQLEQGLRQLAGGVLERLLKSSTDRTWKALLFGAVTTALSQSSSLVSVITIAFLSAGMVGLVPGIGVIFGANLGTTSGAWLVAAFGLKVDIAAWALPLLTFGVLFQFMRSTRLQGIGSGLLGIGLVFLGIDFMKEGFEAFQDVLDLSRFSMDGLAGLMVYTLVGLVATVVMQSSHATLILTITALGAGQLSYDNALAVSIGANIGTTVTAMISSISSNVEGRRLAVAHLAFNGVTAGAALAAMPLFLIAVETVSSWMGIAPESHTMKLAVFHTLFNLAGLVIMVPLIGPLADVLIRHLKAAPVQIDQPQYINEQLLTTPAPALAAARQELLRLLDSVLDLVARVIGFEPAELKRMTDPDLLERPAEKVHPVAVDDYYTSKIKPLMGQTLSFLAELSTSGYRTSQLAELRSASQSLLEAAKAGKHLQKNMVRYRATNRIELAAAYRQLRARLGRLIHALATQRARIEASDLETWLEALKVRSMDDDQAASQRLDEMIRNDLVDANEATSLMNDLVYCRRIEKHLLKAGRRLIPELADRPEGTLTVAPEEAVISEPSR
jgi:phosphate:Na+ symporter